MTKIMADRLINLLADDIIAIKVKVEEVEKILESDMDLYPPYSEAERMDALYLRENLLSQQAQRYGSLSYLHDIVRRIENDR